MLCSFDGGLFDSYALILVILNLVFIHYAATLMKVAVHYFWFCGLRMIRAFADYTVLDDTFSFPLGLFLRLVIILIIIKVVFLKLLFFFFCGLKVLQMLIRFLRVNLRLKSSLFNLLSFKVYSFAFGRFFARCRLSLNLLFNVRLLLR
jgi:hypothetical protein